MKGYEIKHSLKGYLPTKHSLAGTGVYLFTAIINGKSQTIKFIKI